MENIEVVLRERTDHFYGAYSLSISAAILFISFGERREGMLLIFFSKIKGMG